MKAEFEEKTYETELIQELIFKRQLFSPGQVLENRLGFDVALRTKNRDLWNQFGYYNRPRWWPWAGRFPGGLSLNELEICLGRFIADLPKFKFNCFLQIKRPDYLCSKSSKEYRYWKHPYFRYQLTPHQQKILEKLANHVGKEALIAYACPAFYTYERLNKFQQNSQIIKNSNFCEASKLSGHHCYTYIQAGNSGKAHSDTENIESVAFDQSLERLSKIESDTSQTNENFLLGTVKMITEACREVEGYFFFKELADEYQENTESKFIASMAQIVLFERIFNINLLIGF